MKKILIISVTIIIAVLIYLTYGLANFVPNKVVILETERGRIGNQLFQFSAAFSLAQATGRELVIVSKNKYLLEDFSIPAAKIIRLKKLNKFYFKVLLDQDNKFYSLIKRFLGIKPIENVTEENFFNLRKKLSNNILMMQEYFESPIFFDDVKADLLKQFKFKNINAEKYTEILKRLSAKNNFCVHVRRGDMIGNKGREVSINFQKKAIDLAKTIIDQPEFFVFSDSMDLVKEELSTTSNITFIEGYSSIEDLYLMSNCSNNIITKSSFSWWAAYLKKNDAIVIAPYNAYNEDYYTGIEDLNIRYIKRSIYERAYPDDWILLNEEYQDLKIIADEYIKDKKFKNEILNGYKPKLFDIYRGNAEELNLCKNENNELYHLCSLHQKNSEVLIVSSYLTKEDQASLDKLLKVPYNMAIYTNEDNAFLLRSLRKELPMVLIDKHFSAKPKLIDLVSHIIYLNMEHEDYLAWVDINYFNSQAKLNMKRFLFSNKISILMLKEFKRNILDKNNVLEDNVVQDSLMVGDVRAWKIYKYLYDVTSKKIGNTNEQTIILSMIVKYPKLFHLLYKGIAQ